MNQAELQLVAAAQGGDRQAFGALVERYRGRVYAMALAVAGDAEEARELTQETFVRALQNMPRLQAPEQFPGWVRGIAYTISQDLRRKAARERRHLQQAAQERPQARPSHLHEVADREAGAQERALLREQVEALPENCRVALDLRFREGLSYAEIGAAMGVPESTVRGILYRATRALRQKLQPMLKRSREGWGGAS